MKSARYIGMNPDFLGQAALVIERSGRFLAQFHAVNGGRSIDQIGSSTPQGPERHMFGWTPLPKSDFQVIE